MVAVLARGLSPPLSLPLGLSLSAFPLADRLPRVIIGQRRGGRPPVYYASHVALIALIALLATRCMQGNLGSAQLKWLVGETGAKFGPFAFKSVHDGAVLMGCGPEQGNLRTAAGGRLGIGGGNGAWARYHLTLPDGQQVALDNCAPATQVGVHTLLPTCSIPCVACMCGLALAALPPLLSKHGNAASNQFPWFAPAKTQVRLANVGNAGKSWVLGALPVSPNVSPFPFVHLFCVMRRFQSPRTRVFLYD